MSNIGLKVLNRDFDVKCCLSACIGTVSKFTSANRYQYQTCPPPLSSAAYRNYRYGWLWIRRYPFSRSRPRVMKRRPRDSVCPYWLQCLWRRFDVLPVCSCHMTSWVWPDSLPSHIGIIIPRTGDIVFSLSVCPSVRDALSGILCG